jgi:transposase
MTAPNTPPTSTPAAAVPAAAAAAPAEQVCFGIDVAKDKLDLGRSDARAVRTFANDKAGVAALVAHLRAAVPPDRLGTTAIEATGGYEQLVLDALIDAGLPVARVQPGRVRSMAGALNQHAKTDCADARLLAEFARLIQPRLAQRQAAARVELHALVTCRRQLLHIRTEESNRRGTTTSKAALKAIDAVLATLDKQVQSLDRQIRALIDADDDMREADRILQTVPGVSDRIAAVLLAELQELGNTDRRRIASLAGVAPFDNQSGERTGEKHIRGGRATVRNGLYMAALTAARCNPVIKPFYQRLRAKGYKAKYALTACMRKLLGLLNAMLRDGLTWDQLAVNAAKPATPTT